MLSILFEAYEHILHFILYFLLIFVTMNLTLTSVQITFISEYLESSTLENS